MPTRNVFIIGGGVAGMTIAHELKKSQDFEVTIVEAADRLGGFVRTYWDESGRPSEHSPRVFMSDYHNFNRIVSEITTYGNSTVADALVPILGNSPVVTECEILDRRNSLGLVDKLVAAWVLGRHVLFCNNLEDTENIACYDTALVSTTALKNTVDAAAYLMGERPHQLPLYKLVKYAVPVDTFVMNGPYQDVWIDPWMKHLESGPNPVRVLANSRVTSIRKADQTVTGLQITTTTTPTSPSPRLQSQPQQLELGTADDLYVLATGLDASLSLLPGLVPVDKMESLQELREQTIVDQMGIQIYFMKKLCLPFDAFSSNSDWKPIVECLDSLWAKHNLLQLPPCYRSLWSVCLPDVDLVSRRTMKSVRESTEPELYLELWTQLNLNPTMRTWLSVCSLQEVEFKIWNAWDNSSGNYTTNEHYFQNATDTWKLRPDQSTDMDNLFVAGAHTRTSYYSWFVEGAVESGLLVAQKIIPSIPIVHHSPCSLHLFTSSDSSATTVAVSLSIGCCLWGLWVCCLFIVLTFCFRKGT